MQRRTLLALSLTLAAGGAARGGSGQALFGYLSGNGLLSAVAGGYISYDLKLYEAVVRDPIVRGTEENPLSVTSSVFPLPR